MTPFKLTLDAVKAAAREAYAKGELGFQKGEQSCQYTGDATGAPCAVGAALPKEVRQFVGMSHWLNGRGVETLAKEGIVKVLPSELGPIAEIQSAHDSIIHAQRDGETYLIRECVRRFEAGIAE